MKRILCLVLCVMTAAFCCACGNDNKTPTDAVTEAATEAATEKASPDEASDPSGKAGLKEFMASFDDTPTVGDKLIYEDDKLTVEVHGINYAPISGPELHLTVDNRYDKDITVLAPYAVVNGFMMTPELSISAPAGKKANGNLTLPYFSLAIANIRSIREIQFVLRVVEAKNYEPIFTTELITIMTSAATRDEAEPTVDESGQVAYDDNGIKIIFKQPLGAKTDSDMLSPIYAYDGNSMLLVYLYNGTDRAITVQTGDVTVNGYDITSVMNRTVLPGMHAVDTVTFYKMDLTERGIDTIDSVKVSFEIKDADNWQEIDNTDMISVKLLASGATEATETEK